MLRNTLLALAATVGLVGTTALTPEAKADPSIGIGIGFAPEISIVVPITSPCAGPHVAARVRSTRINAKCHRFP